MLSPDTIHEFPASRETPPQNAYAKGAAVEMAAGKNMKNAVAKHAETGTL